MRQINIRFCPKGIPKVPNNKRTHVMRYVALLIFVGRESKVPYELNKQCTTQFTNREEES